MNVTAIDNLRNAILRMLECIDDLNDNDFDNLDHGSTLAVLYKQADEFLDILSNNDTVVVKDKVYS